MRYAAYGPRYWYDSTFDCAPLYADDEWDLAQLDWFVSQLVPRHRPLLREADLFDTALLEWLAAPRPSAAHDVS